MNREAKTLTEFRILDSGQHDDGHPRLRLSGSLDAEATARLSEELDRRLAAGQYLLHLDLSEVTFLSSAGVGILIAYVGEYRDESGDIVIHSASEEVKHVLEILSLDRYVTFGS